MFRESTEEHRRKTKEELLRAFMRDPGEPMEIDDDGQEKQPAQSAADRLDHLHKQLVALEIGAIQTRGVLREWMGFSPYEEGQDRRAPNGLLDSLETAVSDLRIALEDIQALIGGE